MRDTSPSNRNTVKFNVFSYTHTEPVLQAFRHSGSCLTLPVADTQGKNNKSSYKPIAHSPGLHTMPDRQTATALIGKTIIDTDLSAYPTWKLHPGPTQAWRHANSGFKAGAIAGAMWGFVFDIVLFVIPGTDEATMSAPSINWMAATLEGALAFGLLGALIGAGVSLAQSKKSFVTSLKTMRAKRTTPALINPATRFVASGQRDTGA